MSKTAFFPSNLAGALSQPRSVRWQQEVFFTVIDTSRFHPHPFCPACLHLHTGRPSSTHRQVGQVPGAGVSPPPRRGGGGGASGAAPGAGSCAGRRRVAELERVRPVTAPGVTAGASAPAAGSVHVPAVRTPLLLAEVLAEEGRGALARRVRGAPASGSIQTQYGCTVHVCTFFFCGCDVGIAEESWSTDLDLKLNFLTVSLKLLPALLTTLFRDSLFSPSTSPPPGLLSSATTPLVLAPTPTVAPSFSCLSPESRPPAGTVGTRLKRGSENCYFHWHIQTYIPS